MAAFPKLIAHLDEDRFWSYQETIIEAIAVLWIVTSVCAETIKRHYPDWTASRMSPENTDSIGLLWKILGKGQDPCFWERAVAFWKMSDSTVCPNNSTSYFVLRDTRAVAGAAGTAGMIGATIVLYISFICSLLTNSSWREPRRILSVVSLHKFEKVFNIFGSQPKECEILNPPLKPIEKFCTTNRQCQDDGERCKCGWSVFREIGLYLWMVVLLIVGSLIGCVLAALWLLVFILPVVCLAVFAVVEAVVLLGEEAAFPCSVLVSVLLTLYCMGRMSGRWMRSTYLDSIRSIKNFRKRSSTGTRDDAAYSFETVHVTPRFLLVAYKYISYWFPTCFLSIYIFPRLEISYALTERISLNATSETDLSNYTDGTGLDYWDAMLSYWFHTTLSGTSLPDPSVLSFKTGQFCYVWSFLLFWASGIVFKACVIAVMIGSLIALERLKRRRKSTPDKGYPKWYRYFFQRTPDTCWSQPISATCWCAETQYIYRCGCEFTQPILAMLLAFPLLQCCVPEQYHLPVFLLMTTAYAMAAADVVVSWARAHWDGYKRFPYDPLGDRLANEYQALRTQDPEIIGKQGREPAEKDHPTEELKMLNTV